MEGQKSSLLRKSEEIKKLKRFWILGREGDWALVERIYDQVIAKLQYYKHGSEMLLSAHLISVNSAELDMDVIHKKLYGSYWSAFPWDALRLLMTLGFCYWNISVVPVAMWSALMTLKEREHVVGIIVDQVQKWGWAARQCVRDSATLFCIQPVRVPPSGGEYFWEAFLCLMAVVHRHNLLCKHILPQWSEVWPMFPESVFIKHNMPHLKQLRKSCGSWWCT